MKPYTKAIPSTDRRKVAMINAEIIEREKKPAVIGTECGYNAAWLTTTLAAYTWQSMGLRRQGRCD